MCINKPVAFLIHADMSLNDIFQVKVKKRLTDMLVKHLCGCPLKKGTHVFLGTLTDLGFV